MAMAIMVLLVVGVQAGSSVTLNCTEKGNYTYLGVQGSGFTTAIMEIDQGPGGCLNLSYPVVFGFDCATCSTGCQSTIAQFGK